MTTAKQDKQTPREVPDVCSTAMGATRELDRRTNDGIEVRLLWNAQTNRVSVAVEDSRADDSFELEVDATDALDAFHHPYAYTTPIVDSRSAHEP